MISVKNISKSFGQTKALDNINLDVHKNELFGLVGPDGAGKTTLMRILVSLMIPNAGTANVMGFDVVSEYKKIRKNIGYMPGRFSLYTDLTVEENLAFYASVFGSTIEENYHLIKDIYSQIEPFKKRRAGKLSGGMKQKLALSCALIHKPDLLILDEPTTGVDAVSRKEFWDMLSHLNAAGITIVVSTPYMDEAMLCNRVALMQEGKVLAVDTPANIISKYGNDIWMVKSDRTHLMLTALEKWAETKTVYPFGQFVHLTLKNNSIESSVIQGYLNNCGINDAYIEKGFSGIEDVFMEMMTLNKR